ncbi:hypothetical protein TRFO_19831 [Tritrichomonas foetus]|uniref:Uncharacterized protein n=1 Tax=Tritrichomonas foetus TaxID=1144522 RepID=A0A1J4KHD1_9EUKA|nr:hypothetical protein TRFO_19831 [Tritrichomonas foetus]|eukprot:OHT10777.1 hypothetical protein TRFO_19831 [Tritrichomonas foetus]
MSKYLQKEQIYLYKLLLSRPDLDANIKEPKEKKTPLHIAVEFGNINAVNLLVGHPAIIIDEIDKRGKTPLHLACQYSQGEIIEILVNLTENINSIDADKLSPLHYACQSGNYRIVNTLLSNNYEKSEPIDVNCIMSPFSPLSLAVKCGNPAVVELLINCNGIKIHNPLHLLHSSISQGNISIFEMLLFYITSHENELGNNTSFNPNEPCIKMTFFWEF